MGKGDLAKGTLGILLPRLRDERITFFFPFHGMKCALWCWEYSYDQGSPGSAFLELPVCRDIDPSPMMTQDVQEWTVHA